MYQLQQSRRDTITEDRESDFAQSTIPTNLQTDNIIFTNTIMMADKYNIPGIVIAGSMEGTSRCTLGSTAQNTYYLEDKTRSIQQSQSIHTRHFNNIQQPHPKYCELFHQTIHKPDTQHRRKTDPLTNIRHLKHIGALGLTILTSMFKTALNSDIIRYTWRLANIVPIPNPNKYIDRGT